MDVEGNSSLLWSIRSCIYFRGRFSSRLLARGCEAEVPGCQKVVSLRFFHSPRRPPPLFAVRKEGKGGVSLLKVQESFGLYAFAAAARLKSWTDPATLYWASFQVFFFFMPRPKYTSTMPEVLLSRFTYCNEEAASRHDLAASRSLEYHFINAAAGGAFL